MSVISHNFRSQVMASPTSETRQTEVSFMPMARKPHRQT